MEPGHTQWSGAKRRFEDVDTDDGENQNRNESTKKRKTQLQPPAGAEVRVFELALPGSFDFEGFVWRTDGADWQFIQRNYIRGDVRFTWGYKSGIPETAVPFNGEMDKTRMANVSYVLTVGRGSLEELPVEDNNVLIIWKIVLRWYNLFIQSSPKPLKLVFHDYFMDTRRQASRVPEALPIDYPGAQMRVVRERKLCTTQVKEILDKGGDNMGDSLEEWLVTTSTATSLTRSDKIELVSFEWYVHANENDELQRIRAEKWRLAMLESYPEPKPDDLGYWW